MSVFMSASSWTQLKSLTARNKKSTKASGAYTRLPTLDTNEDEESDSELKECIEVLTDHWIYHTCVTGLIVGNAVIIGLETDMPDLGPWSVIENVCLVLFVFELFINIRLQGVNVFFSYDCPDFYWNLFDFSIVTLGILDVLATCLLSSSMGGATVFRVVRLLRIMRLVRIFKFLKKLLLLAVGFVEAAQAIAWTTLLMLVGLYVCSVLMVRTVGRLPKEDPHAEFLHEKFADIKTSMLNLFVLMSSPNLPTYIHQDGLVWERPGLLTFLVCFVIIGSFGMIALLTGVISESMFEKNQIRIEEARKEQDLLVNTLETHLKQIHDQLTLDGNGEAHLDEVREKAMPWVEALFETLLVQYSSHSLRELVEVIDMDGDSRVSYEEFRKAVVTFAAGVKPISIQEVMYAVSGVSRKLEMLLNASGITGGTAIRGQTSVKATDDGKHDAPPQKAHKEPDGLDSTRSSTNRNPIVPVDVQPADACRLPKGVDLTQSTTNRQSVCDSDSQNPVRTSYPPNQPNDAAMLMQSHTADIPGLCIGSQRMEEMLQGYFGRFHEDLHQDIDRCLEKVLDRIAQAHKELDSSVDRNIGSLSSQMGTLAVLDVSMQGNMRLLLSQFDKLHNTIKAKPVRRDSAGSGVKPRKHQIFASHRAVFSPWPKAVANESKSDPCVPLPSSGALAAGAFDDFFRPSALIQLDSDLLSPLLSGSPVTASAFEDAVPPQIERVAAQATPSASGTDMGSDIRHTVPPEGSIISLEAYAFPANTIRMGSISPPSPIRMASGNPTAHVGNTGLDRHELPADRKSIAERRAGNVIGIGEPSSNIAGSPKVVALAVDEPAADPCWRSPVGQEPHR